MIFRKQDNVLLSIGKVIVGSGTLRKVSPLDCINGDVLGSLRVGVMVDDVFDEDAVLPFPVGDTLLLKDALERDVCILWRSLDLDLLSKRGLSKLNISPGASFDKVVENLTDDAIP